MLRLEQTGMRGAVRPDQSVDTEGSIVRAIAKVASVGPEAAAALIALGQPLVDPIPDEATLRLLELGEQAPPLSQVTCGVRERGRGTGREDS